uniref:Uncharacterized protein n=1 Tax=Xiphophorus couchianus TaxID=32473 RepID=A0A3B5KX20_9TELE
MAEQRKQPLTDSTAPNSTQTGRAVALARLLHQECIQLLQLFKKRETSLSDQTPDGVRMVSLSSETTKFSIEEQVRLLHSALRQCLGMLRRVIQKEREELGQQGDGYETLKASVRARLENLLYTTKDLLKSKDLTLEVAQDQQCNEEVDGMGGTFGLKMWTYRVLLELIHWADQAAKTLHVLHTEREGMK